MHGSIGKQRWVALRCGALRRAKALQRAFDTRSPKPRPIVPAYPALAGNALATTFLH